MIFDRQNVLGRVVTRSVMVVLVLLLGGSTVRSAVQKRAFIWIEGHANFERMGTVKGVSDVLERAKSSGFTDVVIDIRGIDGYVLYQSRFAPELREYKGFKRAEDFDYPEVVLREGHKLGMGVLFGMNVFTEGDTSTHLGLGYARHQSWQDQVYIKSGVVPIADAHTEIAIFVNPALQAAQDYELSLIKEVLRKYRPDGIIMDYARYPGMSGDFSDSSRSDFQRFIHRRIVNWPEEVYKIEVGSNGKTHDVPGPYYKKWLEWRAKVIHDFFARARAVAKEVRPNIIFGDYVGAWYPVYFDMGVNWASDSYHTEKYYDWADRGYGRTGYARYLDMLFVGNYFYDVTEKEAIASHTPSPDSGKTPGDYWWYSVDGSAKIANEVVKGATPVYGSLYVQQYVDKNNPRQFVRAIESVMKSTRGIMIFDLSQLVDYNWWKYVTAGLKGE